MILVPTGTSFNEPTYVLEPGVCKDIKFQRAGAYQLGTSHAFLTGSAVNRIPAVPPRIYDLPSFWEGKFGLTVVGEVALPNLKVDAGFTRPKPKSARTRKEFEKLKSEGRIVVSPLFAGSITVRDTYLPLEPKVRDYAASIEVLSSFIKKAQHPCSNHLVTWATCEDNFGVFADRAEIFKPGVVGTHSVRGTLSAYPSKNVSTLLTIHRDKINYACFEINRAINSLEVPRGLVTETASELNQSAYDLLTEIGELPETVSMIYGALKTCLIYYKEVRNKVNLLKRKKQKPVDLLDEIASLWMGYRYGIQPIVYSIQDALDYLEQRGILYRTVRKGENQTVNLDIPGWTFNSPLSLRQRIWAKGRFAATTTNGLGLNPVTTAWELVPLSFVIDWFLNIGDLLGALAPSVSFDEKVFTRSIKYKNVLMGSHPEIPFPVAFEIDLYNREIINPLDHIGLNLDPLLTTKRKLDALALTWMTFLKGFRR